MRMWNVDPRFLCRKHLLGEHVEMHMFLGSILKGKSMRGFIEKGLVEIHNIKLRHHQLKNEMIDRGMNHKSDLPDCNLWTEGKVDSFDNIDELIKRCPDCKKRIYEYL